MAPPNPSQRLLVRIGPSLDNLTHHNVNDDANPVFVDSPLFVGYVIFRVKNFNGVTPDGSPAIATSDYFTSNEARKRLFSIQCQGRVKEEIRGDHLVQGNTWQKKIRVPWGANIVLKLAEMIDSTFSHDLYAAKPWTMSTVLSSQNLMHVTKATHPLPTGPISSADAERLIGKWNPREPSEDNTHLLSQLTDAMDRDRGFPFSSTEHEQRRKFFQKKKHREMVTVSPDYIFAMENFAPTVDFNTFDIHMGVTLNMLKVTDNQPYVFEMRSAERGVLFVIECRLVDVDGVRGYSIPGEREE
ncbi:hypothetical protein HDU98_000833 [Podochytrium sp. JEL0797]|nr:hypothetical protein HDU98_000833 [Podochytrium sp. JEL0797]